MQPMNVFYQRRGIRIFLQGPDVESLIDELKDRGHSFTVTGGDVLRFHGTGKTSALQEAKNADYAIQDILGLVVQSE